MYDVLDKWQGFLSHLINVRFTRPRHVLGMTDWAWGKPETAYSTP